MTKLLAIYEAVKHFRHMLEARQFTILTDHKPLTFTFHQKRDKCSPRQFNQLDFISQFTTDIRHISEQDNIVADTLSRVEVIATSVTHDALAAAQVDDDELQTLLVTQLYSLQKSSFPVPQSNCTAIYLLANHDHTSHLLSAVKYLVPYILSATPELKQRLSSLPNAWCGQPFKKTAALGPSLPTLPMLQSISPHHHSSWRLHPPSCPLSTQSYRPGRPTTFLRRISLLPHRYRSFHTLARSFSYP